MLFNCFLQKRQKEIGQDILCFKKKIDDLIDKEIEKITAADNPELDAHIYLESLKWEASGLTEYIKGRIASFNCRQ